MIVLQAQLCWAGISLGIFSAFFSRINLIDFFFSLALTVLKSMESHKWKAKLQDNTDFFSTFIISKHMPATKDSFWNSECLGLLSSGVRNIIDSFYLYMKIMCTARIKAQKIGWNLVSKITQVLLKIIVRHSHYRVTQGETDFWLVRAHEG